MPVDKFERNGHRATPVYTGINIANLTNSFASGKIKMCEMWVERLEDEWIATSSPMFATAWPDFHKFSRTSLMTFFSRSPPVVGLAAFVSTI